eukprot:scaffold19953_cov51-Phaeocystis_antarctica.AAC.1
MGARRQLLTPSGVVIQSVKDAGTVVGGGDVRAAVWSRLHSRRAYSCNALATPKVDLNLHILGRCA